MIEHKIIVISLIKNDGMIFAQNINLQEYFDKVNSKENTQDTGFELQVQLHA